jgi:hypothetical protein
VAAPARASSRSTRAAVLGAGPFPDTSVGLVEPKHAQAEPTLATRPGEDQVGPTVAAGLAGREAHGSQREGKRQFSHVPGYEALHDKRRTVGEAEPRCPRGRRRLEAARWYPMAYEGLQAQGEPL